MSEEKLSPDSLECLMYLGKIGWTCITKGWSSDPKSKMWYPLHQLGYIYTGPPPNNPQCEMVYLTPKGLAAYESELKPDLGAAEVD